MGEAPSKRGLYCVFVAIACFFICLSISVIINGIMGAIAAAPVFAQDGADIQSFNVSIFNASIFNVSINVNDFNPRELLLQALRWLENLGYIGGLVFIFLYIIATVAFIPGSVLTLGAGVVFGVFFGAFYVLIGATMGAIAAFLVGRYLARDWVSQKIAGNQKFAAIDQAVADAGFKIVLLTRLSPIFPFNLLNYAFGITGVSLKDYAIASVGMFPGTVMYVYIGSLAGDLARIGSDHQPTDNTIQWIIRMLGFIATVAVTVYVTRIARNALAEQVGQ